MNLRKAIKDFGIQSQDYTCCYCREITHSNSHKVWEVEHVLPLSDFAQFAFEPLNLAISCPDCNTAKSNKKVSNTKAKKNVPTQSAIYFIVHPHLDNYDEHIKKSGLFFYPKSKKGRKTIETCGLLRLAEKYVDWESLEEVERIEAEAKALQGNSGDQAKIKGLISDLLSLL
ncbi:HNH endonuclease [Primorskyibacter sedentarius]|uniref:HNH endonuclease n=2 Tax=Primorskyibacter sedentarius TaxID=745311 RepID=A0A4R3J4Y0_9RHOB|nr:HNH endonuclease [Primorskyibacter sedentarius]